MNVRVADLRLGRAAGTTPVRQLNQAPLRWLVVGLATVAVGLFAWSFFLPWWQMKLFAPQYPNGLGLEISLTGLGGDVREINMLNHYIGMEGLDKAAQVERAFAAYGVGFVALASLVLVLLAGRKLNWLVVLPGLAFPLGFIADSFYWMYTFGHSLDPRAPLEIPPFTPQLFGGGHIGQFYTWAGPHLGFWAAVAAVGLLVASVLVRRRICDHCPLVQSCGNLCSRMLVLPVDDAAAPAKEPR